jgi:hypothetical protein
MDLRLPTTASGQLAHRLIGSKRSLQRKSVRIDGRSTAGKQIRALIKTYSAAIGEAAREPLTMARIRELSEIEVLCARVRADAINGKVQGSVWGMMFELGRMTNTASRLRDKLGLSAVPADIVPTIDELLAQADNEDAA